MKINANGTEISLITDSRSNEDYISLTDIAKYRNPDSAAHFLLSVFYGGLIEYVAGCGVVVSEFFCEDTFLFRLGQIFSYGYSIALYAPLVCPERFLFCD